jgi:hypothetical protein
MKKILYLFLAFTLATNLFAQDCNTISTLTWEENFNNCTTSLQCWTIVNNNPAIPPNRTFKLFEDGSGGCLLYSQGYDVGKMYDETATMPEFDFTNYAFPVLSFDFVLNPQWTAGSMSDLVVEVTVNDGTPVVVWSEEQESFEWHDVFAGNATRAEIPLAAFGGLSNVKITFHYTGDNGAMVRIDNVKIENVAIPDVAILAITAPAHNSGLSLSNAETVQISVKNNGGEIITALDATLEVDGTVIGTTNFTGISISSMATTVLTLNHSADLSASGGHILRVWLDYAGDGFADNDSLHKIVNNYICDAVDVSESPYILDFETGFHYSTGISDVFNQMNYHCWDVFVSCDKSQNVTKPLDWGVNAFGIFKPEHSTHFDGYGNYGLKFSSYEHSCGFPEVEDFEIQAVVSPKLLPTTYEKYLRAWTFAYTEGDSVWFGHTTAESYSSMDDLNWEYLPYWGTGIRNELRIPGNITYVGFKYTGRYKNYGGVDDIEIGTYKPDVKLEGIDVPVLQAGNYSAADTVVISVKNLSNMSIYDFYATLEVDGTIIGTEPLHLWVMRDSIRSVTLTNTANLSAAGNHSIRVWIKLDGDIIAENDTLEIHIISTATMPLENTMLSVYPNPVKTELFVTKLGQNSNKMGTKLEIYDVSGKLQFVTTLLQPCHAISVVDLKSGTYFLKIGNEVVKFMKE